MNHVPSWLRSMMSIKLISGPLPVAIYTITVIGVITLIVWQLLRNDRSHLVKQSLIALLCGLLGLLLTWFASDGIMLFGVSLGWSVIITVAIAFALAGPLIVTAASARRLRRAIAIIMIPIMILATALRIDMIYGEYQTIGSLVNYAPYQSLDEAAIDSHATISVSQWRTRAAQHQLPSMPATGTVYEQHIANTQSGFQARKALIYLPPAALSATPPRLPVLLLLSGQPGSPGRAFSASGIAAMMDHYARTHDGLAPIVISPDQNGADTINSLCADTTLHGKAETYLTVDVPAWIHTHLPVSKQASHWAMSGFSQGGTCSTQLVPRHPDLFGTMIAVDGEIAPTDGSIDHMVATYFAGNRAAYEAQVPVNAIAAHSPSDQAAILAAGSNDHTSVKNIQIIGAAARKAGMEVTMLEVPGTGHDWHAATATLEAALPWWCARVGLGDTETTWHDYQKVKVIQ